MHRQTHILELMRHLILCVSTCRKQSLPRTMLQSIMDLWDLSPFPLLFIPFVQLHHFTNRKYLIMTWFFLLFLIIPIFCMKSKKIKERKKMEGKFYLMISNKRKCYLFSNAIPFMFSHLHSLCSTFSLNLVITFRYFLIPSLFSRPRIHHPAPATTQFIRIQFDSILLTM